MNRRDFLKRVAAGATVTAAGLVVPDQALAVGEEVTRRWWALGGMPGPEYKGISHYYEAFRREAIRQKRILEESRIQTWAVTDPDGIPREIIGFDASGKLVRNPEPMPYLDSTPWAILGPAGPEWQP